LAETIGELIVEITTEASKFNAGLKEAEKQVKDTAGKINEWTNKIALVTTAAGAAITAAYAAMIKLSVDYGDQIYEVSQRTGVAVDTLSRLKYVADQTESSFEAVAMGLKFLNKNIYEATNGNFKLNETFRAMGIILKDETTGEVMKAEDAFFRIADVFKNTENAAAKTALAMQVFGRQGEALIPVLNLGSAEIQRLSREAERLGLVLTTENAKAIDQFSDSTKSLKGALGGLWLEISLTLLPALEHFTKVITDLIVKFREFGEAHPQLTKFISELGLALGVLMLALGPVIFGMNQLIQFLLYIPKIGPPVLAFFASLRVLLASFVPLLAVITAAFAGWKLAEWLDNNSKKIQEFWWRVQSLFQSKPKGPVMEFDIGTGLGQGKNLAEPIKEQTAALEKQNTVLDETVTKAERHVQVLKELNEQYLGGKINAEQYYNSVKELHADGLDIKQQELDLLQKSIDLERLATESEYQKIYVMQQGIQSAQEYYRVKAELENQDIMNQQITLDAATNLLRTIESMHKTIWQGIFDFANMILQKFSSGFSTALTSIIMGTQKASDAFKQFGLAMIQAIVEFVIEYAVQALIAMTIGSMVAAATMLLAGTIAAAWYPAALLASIATLGGAVATGTAALGGAMATSIGVAGALESATIFGEGEAGFGASFGGSFGEGGSGVVTKPTLFLAGEEGPERYSFTPVDKEVGNTINITIESPIISSDVDIRDLAEQIGFETERSLRRVA